jgi:hypothetical protein
MDGVADGRTFNRDNWQAGPENRARGLAWLGQLYKQDLGPIFQTFAAHKDFGESLCLPSTVEIVQSNTDLRANDNETT